MAGGLAAGDRFPDVASDERPGPPRAAADLGAAVDALRSAPPGRPRLEAYETLLRAVADGTLYALLWHGEPGSPDAQYGSMEVAGYGYVPTVSSPAQLAASGWQRAHEACGGRELAAVLYPSRWGLWLDPHAAGGGVGVPWADLRRVALGLDRLPAGPLEISEPAVAAEPFYEALKRGARAVPGLRALRRAWVAPALGEPYLAIGLELDDPHASADDARAMVRRALAEAAPADCRVAVLAAPDEDDSVALWMAAGPAPFYRR
ncbi:enhanced serine sensitivity protein SseB C-terminal domain-containing protein [Phaeacidiphilus oryzae]|uniref:enhanced serine sensitivity protein SseB C-terminal domain-containing protein n=1 Tax=Phaeacidiphilus oryzae TaxID=348818 RepID=UPI000AE3DC3B|nr:enhanced serine sensitivity protein SseB C-terminal domain-containing protein [Phaeacidiphilus oryzae]